MRATPLQASIVDIHAAHAEVAHDFVVRLDRERLSIGLRGAEAFIVHEEEGFFADERTADGATKLVLHEMIVAHRAEAARVHGTVAEEFVSGAVEFAGAGMSNDVDLTAACAAHVGGVAAGFDLKLLNRVRRWAEVLGIEGGIGIGGAVEQEEIGIGASAADDDG